jgi:hypothetical protein
MGRILFFLNQGPALVGGFFWRIEVADGFVR